MDDTQTTGQDVPADQTVDTTETQTSEANVGEETKTPEATQEQATAQEAEAPETKAEDTVEEKLYAGKYKTVEDMERAYQELNSKFTNTSQEKAELARILDEAFYSPEPEVAQPQTDDYGLQEETPQPNAELEQLRRDNAVTKFILAHDDADAASMKEVLATDPFIKQIQGHEAKLEYAYQKTQNMSHAKALKEAEKAGQQKAQAKTAEKQVAQVESAKKSAPVNNKAELLERMRYGDRNARAEVISNIDAVKQMRKMAGLE